MKKTYQKPLVQIIEMQADSAVLTGSGSGIPVKPGKADGNISPMNMDDEKPSIWHENLLMNN